ncbi:LacI family DNA-binding transcriptional regulator [Streptomyces sp. NPDC051180]|uniref:LacI family DNA-binding transcriptional regulator n=1 Tax=Streptomyces sp. NPDC051180 TaxID=3155797 RepID=UPI00344BA3B1
MSEERTGGPGGRVTLDTVAVEAGVSASTVSKVLNGGADVSAVTRRRVEAVMDSLGYRRRAARLRAGFVDLVLDELDSLRSVEIVRGVAETLHAAGVRMVLSAVHGRDDGADVGTGSGSGSGSGSGGWIDRLAARRSSGAVLVVSELTSKQRRRLTAMDVPVVRVDPAGHVRHVGHVEALVPTFGATNWEGAVSATEHLIGLGHTRIAHLAGPRQLLCSRARADGYRAAMERAGLRVPEGFTPHGEPDDTSGRREAARLLDALAAAGEQPPTAIFAASDLQALGALEELRARGRRIPEDVSVVGFDDLPVARRTHPPLTTVRQPLFDMAAMAARTLLRIIDGEPVPNHRLELATRLVVRGSTAPPT